MWKIQSSDGSWTPLWFGDQDAKDERSPVYGTAMAVEYLSTSRNPLARKLAENGLRKERMELSHRRYTERDTGQILVTVPCELGMP
ncbi:hypothetical protein, partial [Parabacteroides distasonis]|uniref:hypothetical protein n=1 Tax=Parabacteroides distasonis TaxID=823 RepID=UPI00210E040B